MLALTIALVCVVAILIRIYDSVAENKPSVFNVSPGARCLRHSKTRPAIDLIDFNNRGGIPENCGNVGRMDWSGNEAAC